MKYDYIPSEFGRTWVASRNEARRGIFTPLAYIDINEGNRFDADVFAQIMYWHEPNSETGQSRLSRFKDGFYWLTKNHADWFAETRIKYQTVRKCLARLKDRNLIFYEPHGEEGKKCPWIRVNWDEFERRMRLWLQESFADIGEKQYDKAVTIFNAPVTTEQGVCSGITEPLLSDNTPLLPDVKSNTETTPKPTSKTVKEKVAPNGAKRPIFTAIGKYVFNLTDLKGIGGGRLGKLEKVARRVATAHLPNATDDRIAELVQRFAGSEKFKPAIQGESGFELKFAAYLQNMPPQIVPDTPPEQPPPAAPAAAANGDEPITEDQRAEAMRLFQQAKEALAA